MARYGQLFWLAWILSLAGTGQAEALSPPRGYQARACNFDLDDDFVYGEAVDDCNVCDGQSGSGPVTVDYDGDSVNETEVYVDYDSGANSPGRGGPSNPYRTLVYAIGQEGAGEIAYCIRGSTTDQQIQPGSGGSGTKTRPASGSEMLDFQYPSNPLMIVGWDTDDDGQYPPVDPDDSGTVDMTQVTAFFWLQVLNSSIEIAHLDISGNPPADNINIFRMGNCGQGNTYSNIYFHDLDILNYNQNRGSDSNNNAFATWTNDCGVSWLALENINATNVGGGFFTRGNAGNSDAHTGPYQDSDWRFKSVSVTVDALDGTIWQFSKHWGELSRVEYIDIYIDYQAGVTWTPGATPASECFTVAQCAQDILIRNNRCEGAGRLAHFQASASGFCSTRPVCNSAAGVGNGCIVDGNEFIHNYDYIDDQLVSLSDGGIGSTSVGDVYITNNIMNASTATRNCFEDGSDAILSGSTITIVGNTFEGILDSGNNEGCIWMPDGSHENWDVRNNIFGMTGNRAISDANNPTGWSADYNVYPAGSGWWRWNGVNQFRLANWQSASGGDNNALRCSPTYVGGGDYHLASSDTCAQDRGGDISDVTIVDIDLETRGQGSGYDIGADEVPASSSRRPPTANLLRLNFRDSVTANSSSVHPLPQQFGGQVLLILRWANPSALLLLRLQCENGSEFVSRSSEQSFIRMEAAVERPASCVIEVSSQRGSSRYWLNAQVAPFVDMAADGDVEARSSG